MRIDTFTLVSWCVVAPLVLPLSSGACTSTGGYWGNDCTTTNTGTAIVVEGTQDLPPGPVVPDVDSGADAGGGDPGDGGRAGERVTVGDQIWMWVTDVESGELVYVCRSIVREGACDDVAEPEVDPRDTVTIADLATFAPATPELVSDPEGAGVMGAHANIVATANTHTVTGTLFGEPVMVRFTPVTFTFDYGDGATTTTDSGGATWEALGVSQFTPTATSHVYRARGTYTVTTTVDYAADVQFASDGVWRSIPGILTGPSSSTSIRIYEARTALVEHTCAEDPNAAGC